MTEVGYYATDPDYGTDLEANRRSLLTSLMQSELLKRYDRGILSLAERNSCSLMWSHYGD